MVEPHHGVEDEPEPPQVRRLRLLVSALALVLMVGVVVVAATLVIRLVTLGSSGPDAGRAAPPPVAAEEIRLPAGETVTALGRSGTEILVTTRAADGDERLRAFDAATGAERSVTAIRRE